MITIKIQTGNSSFVDNYSKALNQVLLQIQNKANEIEEEGIKLPKTIILWDENGNSIGLAKFDNK